MMVVPLAKCAKSRAAAAPEIVADGELESLRASLVQMASSASQLVVAGSRIVTAALESGLTVIVQLWLLPFVLRRAPRDLPVPHRERRVSQRFVAQPPPRSR